LILCEYTACPIRNSCSFVFVGIQVLFEPLACAIFVLWGIRHLLALQTCIFMLATVVSKFVSKHLRGFCICAGAEHLFVVYIWYLLVLLFYVGRMDIADSSNYLNYSLYLHDMICHNIVCANVFML
jgi:hypothetical protein